MPHMTQSEWNDKLESCGHNLSNEQIIDLVYKDGPNALWTDIVHQKHLLTEYSVYRYLQSFFSTSIWPDGIGDTEIGQKYHAAYIPFDMSIFQRTMEVCSPSSQNECHTDYCTIPQGGLSSMPELEMYKTGFKTEPRCVANYRTSERAKRLVEMLIQERFQVDEQVMNAFYTMAMIRMLGHKWVLEYTQEGNELVPIANNNPRNMMGGFQYNYLNPLFPQAGNLNNIAPFSFDALERFGRGLVNSRNPNFIAKGKRGEPIYELWHTEDWYRTEVLDNAEYIERMKYTMPSELLTGYSLEGGEQEIIGNFHMKVMPQLPKFTESSEGGLTVVQPLKEVAVDFGSEAIHNFAQWDNAPFLLTVAISSQIGEILSRPAITTGVEGLPIMPITGNGEWMYRNDYDKECNEDLNMPHMRKRYEMGFKLKNPEAGWGFISRAKKFRWKPINACDMRDIFKLKPSKQDCSILTIGCNPKNTLAENNIMESNGSRKVLCSGEVCGDDTIYRVSFRKENQDSIAPNQSPLGGCGCGDTVNVYINNGATGQPLLVATGGQDPVVEGKIIEIFRPNNVSPRWSALIQLEDPLVDGYCIGSVACPAGEEESVIVACNGPADNEDLIAGQISVILSKPLACAQSAGADANIAYYDADGELIADEDIDVTIVSYDPVLNKYVFSAVGLDCSGPEGACKAVVTCA
jgi:hypothetical protein